VVRATICCTTEPPFDFPKSTNDNGLIFLPNASCRKQPQRGAFDITMRLNRLPGNGGFSEVVCGQVMLPFNEVDRAEYLVEGPYRGWPDPHGFCGLSQVRSQWKDVKLVTIQLAVYKGIPGKGTLGGGYR
jgi:hypothetical protein